MPQDTIPFLITYGDTSFLLSSMEEYNHLPDSLKQPEVLQQIQIYLSENYPAETDTKDTPVVFMLVSAFMFIMFMKMIWSAKKELHKTIVENSDPNSADSCLTYKGAELHFGTEEIKSVCLKYNSYFRNLSPEKQSRFIERVQQFIRHKNFHIYSSKGYKEMPILISAAAIQISFGLSHFLLPHFSDIIIHPEEYFATDPLRILVGNVHGQSITLSWKHFLDDYQKPADGKNVGLHEMAHALQVQYLFRKSRGENEFKHDFEHYDRIDDKIRSEEKIKTNSLFDKNALSNQNEFWATSVELFFEKPADLKQDHPALYESICNVLNQDMLHR